LWQILSEHCEEPIQAGKLPFIHVFCWQLDVDHIFGNARSDDLEEFKKHLIVHIAEKN
jgi:hypothetical protein